jgi:hypothetical protein
LIRALRRAPTPPEPVPPPDLRTAGTVEKGHGRIETRTLSVSHECAAHLGWPGAQQVCRIERTREIGGRVSREIAYAVTSLPPEQAGPDRLLGLWRDHWLIENRLHWRRDVVAREDQSRLRSGAAPQAMAAIRNTTLFMLRGQQGSLRSRRAARAENRLQTIKAAINGFFE